MPAVTAFNQQANYDNSVEFRKQGIFSNQSYQSNQPSPIAAPQSVEESKKGIFANPNYSTESSARLSTAKLAPGGDLLTSSVANGNTPTSVSFGNSAGSTASDWRIRVSANPSAGILYWDSNPGILLPLLQTDGVIFPYVPAITVSYQAKYGSQPLTHTNYNNYFYEASEVQAISINADFSVQDVNDGLYFLAALYFFRATTKMFYGSSGQFQGSPPPIVYLNGYGAHYLPNISCIVTSFNHSMPQDVDYLAVEVPGSGTTRVPLFSTFSLSLQPVLSREKQRTFDYGAFARGELINKGFL